MISTIKDTGYTVEKKLIVFSRLGVHVSRRNSPNIAQILIDDFIGTSTDLENLDSKIYSFIKYFFDTTNTPISITPAGENRIFIPYSNSYGFLEHLISKKNVVLQIKLLRFIDFDKLNERIYSDSSLSTTYKKAWGNWWKEYLRNGKKVSNKDQIAEFIRLVINSEKDHNTFIKEYYDKNELPLDYHLINAFSGDILFISSQFNI